MQDTSLSKYVDAQTEEALLERFDNGSGVVLVVSETEQERSSFIYALAHALASRLQGHVGQEISDAAATPICFFDTAQREPIADTVSVTEIPMEQVDQETFTQALRMATRHDPYALVFTNVAQPFMAPLISQQADMHLIVVGVAASDTATIDTLTKNSTLSTKLVERDGRWELAL
jgi:hypothetical protein